MGLKTCLLLLLAAVGIFFLMHTTIADPRKQNQKNKIVVYKPWWCEYKFDMGPCTHFQVKYYYDSKKNACNMFVWGGCEGNANKFDNERMCRKVCLLTKTPPKGGF